MTAQQPTSWQGELLHHEMMSKHTSWRVGGPADSYYKPLDLDDLCVFLEQLAMDEPLTWLGLGSNLLVRDGGIRGTVISTSGLLNNISLLNETELYVEAGVSCAKVARFAARQNLTGVEFLAGIPGTMGGALAMNAGAFGGETWSNVKQVTTLSRTGMRMTHDRDDYQIGYRSVKGPEGEWFVSAVLSLTHGDVDAGQIRIKQLLTKRAETQPTKQASCGSVFRNPEGDHAARLIETAGLKATCIGGACVSEKHANFIVNTGDARAADIEALIEKVAETVQQQHGVALQREVHIIGEAEVNA